MMSMKCRLFKLYDRLLVCPQCCASARSFTVVVLMRDESGYMMLLLLLLPFHQQRKPTNTHQTHKWYRGIPLWQRASCPHKHRRFSVSKTEKKGLFLRLFVTLGKNARSRFFLFLFFLFPFSCTCSGCVFSTSSRAWHYQGNQPWLRGLHQRSIDSRRFSHCFGYFAASCGSIQPDSPVPWSPHQSGPERRKQTTEKILAEIRLDFTPASSRLCFFFFGLFLKHFCFLYICFLFC